jgi:hypothetical protein
LILNPISAFPTKQRRGIRKRYATLAQSNGIITLLFGQAAAEEGALSAGLAPGHEDWRPARGDHD